MEVDGLEADLAAWMALRIEPRLELDGLLVELGHPSFEALHTVVGEHPELGLCVRLGEAFAQPQCRECGLEAESELSQSEGAGRGGPPEESQGDAGNHEAEGGVDDVGLQVDAAALRPDLGEELQLHAAVVVGEPAGKTENADLLAGRRLESGGPVVVSLAAHRDVAVPEIAVRSEAAAVPPAKRHRHGEEGKCCGPGEDVADDEGRGQ